MLLDLDIKYFLDSLFDTLDPGITKLDHFTGIGKNDMIMLTIEIGFFILSLVLTKLVFPHETAFQQKFYSVIKSRPANPVFLVLHLDVKRFYIKMIIGVINFLKNCESFRCFTMPFLFKIFGKNIFNDRLVVLIYDFFAHNLLCKGISLFTAYLVYPVNFFEALNDGIQDIVILYHKGNSPAEDPI